jgi:branched-chain amino acid transport system substrate-binding protein
MKKTLAVVIVLLVPVLAIQVLSLRQFSDMREWFAGRAPQEILVGVAWPFALNQDGMDEGLLLAQEELNTRGVRGRRIRLLMRDDRLDREESRKAAVDFARDPRIAAVIGYDDDRFAVRASAIFEESHLLHIVTGANNTYMTSRGFRYLIRSVLASDRISRGLARMCMERGYRKYALIAEDGAFGEDLAYQFGTELDAMDAHVVHQSSYVRGQVDFHETINDLKSVDADVILLAGFETESARFIKLAHDLKLKTPIIGAFYDTAEMHAIAGKALNGTMFYSLYDVNSPTPENRAFVAKYRRRFGRDPDFSGAQGYDALRILAKAVEATGSTNSLDLAYAIRFMDRWEGANGSYKFDSTGELEDKNIYLKVYRGEKPVVLATGHTAPVPTVPVPAAPVPTTPGPVAPGPASSVVR